MLPVFESCAPFYRWVSRKFVLGTGEVEVTPEGEVGMLDEVLDGCVARETGETVSDVQSGKLTGTGRGWDRVVGVLGFSQGARLVPGLLLRQLHHSTPSPSKWSFRFGVMVGGPYPPISLHPVEVSDYALLKTIPTVHAWGRDDHVKSGCVQLREICDNDDHCFEFTFEGGHHMPLTDGEARDLCDLIRAAYYAGGGTMELGVGEKY
jgi:hypothetical protein